MNTFMDFLLFRKMLSPWLLQVLFWAGIGGTLYGTYVLIRLGNWAWWVSLVVGCLATRVIFERVVVSFRTYDRLNEITELLKRGVGESQR